MYDSKQRQHIYNWREKNPEKYKEVQKKAQKKYVEKNRKRMSENTLRYYYRHRDEILAKAKKKKEK